MKLPNLDLAFIDRNKLWNYSLNTQNYRFSCYILSKANTHPNQTKSI
jgi:hypothetical protein